MRNPPRSQRETEPNQAKTGATPGATQEWSVRKLYVKTTEEPQRNQAKPSQTKPNHILNGPKSYQTKSKSFYMVLQSILANQT